MPSPALLATKSAPMLPPAPGLLSTVTGWPRAAHLSASTRASVSGAPPGGNVTTILIGLVGHTAACAWAAAVSASPTSNTLEQMNMCRSESRRRERMGMAVSLGVCQLTCRQRCCQCGFDPYTYG